MCEISGSTLLQISEPLQERFVRLSWVQYFITEWLFPQGSHCPWRTHFKEQVWLLNGCRIIFNNRHFAKQQNIPNKSDQNDCLTLNQSTLTEFLSTSSNSILPQNCHNRVSFSFGPVTVLGSSSKLQFYALRTQSSLLSSRTSWSFNISVKKILPGFFCRSNDQKNSAESVITAQRLLILTMEK